MSECARCPLRSRKAIVAVHPSAYALSRVTITIWKDMFTKRPADGQAVLGRRTIWETAPIFGYWNGEGDCLVCGTDGWTLKDFDLWKWRAVKGALPPWPVPGPVKGWSDVWHTPPEDQQPVWLRRMGRITAAVPALWDLTNMGFYVGISDNLIPWQYVWRWKPRDVA